MDDDEDLMGPIMIMLVEGRSIYTDLPITTVHMMITEPQLEAKPGPKGMDY